MATRTTRIRDYSAQSEYSGETRNNTVLKKSSEHELTAVERLRLLYVTGTEDVTAEPDRRAWLGFNSTPNSVIDFVD